MLGPQGIGMRALRPRFPVGTRHMLREWEDEAFNEMDEIWQPWRWPEETQCS